MPPGPHLPDLATLTLLVDVARTGSIGGAAREAGVTQQAASARLKATEAQVGVPLLQRGARGSELTAAGRVLVEGAVRLLDVAAEVEQAVEALRTDRGRELHVGASMTVAEHLLPGWLVQLRRRQVAAGQEPTSVSLVAANSRDVTDAVLVGEAAVGFVEGVAAPSGLSSSEVGHDELVLVAAPDDPLLTRRRALTPGEVAALALTSRERGSGTREVVVSALGDHGLSPATPSVELGSTTAIRETVRAGGAPAFLSRLAVGRDLDAGHLVEVPVRDLDLRRSLRAVWVGGSTPPAGPVRDLLAIASASQQ
ncbi:LysR family transcriptional regulator [Solicola sp. PLA-1-18]|uniref:LysR family transcriptional regulator n=1 Tax=Solicola sp. PLA-1-18 TaxID=3380532 RepID=UPI003B7925D6